MNLAKVNFPVFPLSNDIHTTTIDKALVVVYYDKELNTEIYKYVDDTSIPKDTLGSRRLVIKLRGDSLYPLREAIYFLGDLIKIAKVNNTFIDSSGKLFKYTKTKLIPLKFYSIDRIIQIPTGGSIISVVGLLQRFKTLARVDSTKKYVGLLCLTNKQYILYGVYNNKEKDTWRKI